MIDLRRQLNILFTLVSYSRMLSSFRIITLRNVSRKSSCSTTKVRVLASSETSSASEPSSTKSKVPAKFVSFPFEYHELVEMKVEKIISRGWGIGRVDISDRIMEHELSSNQLHDDQDDVGAEDIRSSPDKNRWIVMVPGVIPSERVLVRIFRNFARYSEADLTEIIEASPDRVSPICKLSEICGGCQLQHMNIESQRSWKTLQVLEALDQYNVTLPTGVRVQETIGTDEIYRYRSKLTPHYQIPSSNQRKSLKKQNQPLIQSIGFQGKSSRQIVDVDSCHIATPAVNEAYQAERNKLLNDRTLDRKQGATLLFRQANLDTAVTSNHQDVLTTNVNGLAFTYQAGNFFQNNYYVLPLMVEHVIQQATKGSTPPTHLVDCYCGSGLFAISAASHFEKVVGIEINDKAVAEATANARQNGISNCSFQAASAEHIFADLTGFPVNQTAVVLDPPRKGCSDEFLVQLYAFGPQRIIYMSCDPVTQARDAAGILNTDKYRLTFAQPFDLFPQTRHIESLMIFERKSRPKNDDSQSGRCQDANAPSH